MSFDSDHKHLKNSEIYLGAFSEMVATFHRSVNDAKAAEHDGDSDAADAAYDVRRLYALRILYFLNKDVGP